MCIGLPELKGEVCQHYFHKPLNSLCSTEDSSGKIVFKCLVSASPLEPILTKFHLLFSRHQSDIFRNVWSSKLQEAKQVQMTISDVVTHVWDPVFEECCLLIDNIQSRRIKLQCVDHYFRCFHIGSESVSMHIRKLFVALEACHNREVQSLGWIQSAVDRMEQYWSLCELAKAAKIILDLRESTKLTGNFDVIESVASEVATSMKEASLENIDQKLIGAKSFLEQFTNDPSKMDCLRNFSDSMSLIEWIRKETKGS